MDKGKDEEVECDVCGNSHVTEECPELGLSSSKFTPQISRARLTVPHYLNPLELPDGGVTIVALEPISNKTQLGPFEAKKTMHDIDQDHLFVLKILSKDGSFISLDASSESHCNWMALVQVAQNEEEQNCMAYQLGINIYFNTTRDVAVGDELKVWYASQYAKKLGKSLVPDGKTKSMLGEQLPLDTDDFPEPEEGEASENDGQGRSKEEDSDSHPDDIEGDFTCNHCGKKFVSQFMFAKHIREHLFPEYDYVEGPPRRGRRPVPLKLTDHRSTRGSGRGRPRGRGGGRRRGRRFATHRPGCFTRSEVQQILDETENASPDLDMYATNIDDGTEEGFVEIRPVKRRPGRPRKVVVEPDPEAPLPPTLSSAPEEDVSAPQDDEVEAPVVEADGDSGRCRRSSRISRNLNKLSKWFKYPGESLEEEEKMVKVKEESGGESRKRFGVAMAASLRKAAMDEMTSPSLKRKSETKLTPAKAKVRVVTDKKCMTSKTEVVITKSEEVSKEPSKGMEGGEKTPSHASGEKTPSHASGEKSPSHASTVPSSENVDQEEAPSPTKRKQDDESPKKYLIISENNETTSFDISALEKKNSDDVSSAETPSTSSSPVKSIAITFETDEVEVSPQTETVSQSVEIMEVSEVPKVEGDVIITTSEEKVVSEARKNTIADLDGTDALTALVNAAISADKVPDPIAMVAADLYDEKNMVDDDGDDYRAPNRQILETADEGEDSGDDRGNQPARQKRKKRRKGDDPELEALESLTKKMEGPNGTEEFACGVCNKHFTQFKYLKLHLPAHTDRFRCVTCGKRFARNESLVKHTCDDTASLVEQVTDANGGDLYNCKECGRTFSQLTFALRHASMHRTRFPCEKCGRTFPRQDMLDEHDCTAGHLEEGEVTSEGYECQICKQAFTNGKYLFRHMAMHTDIYKCEVCGKCYCRKDSLQRHISRCCPELSEEYSVHMCQNCKKTFGTQLGLQNHLLNCGKYQCDACRVAFFSPKDLEEHECAGKVLNEKASVQFPCKECGKTFASIAYLVRHEASHHGAFKCDMCSRVFIRKEELNWHTPVCVTRQKIVQEGSAPCEVCGEVYNELLAFKEHHMTHTHPHKCDKCGKRFIKVGTLHNHKCDGVMENGEIATLLSCEICQKPFKNERYLSRHLSLHKQPEYSCDFCGKMFTRKDYLNDHQCRMPDGSVVRVVRKKNRLFIKDNLACPDCGKTFSSRSNMMKHMKVHGEKQAECPVCHKKFHYENYLKLHIATVHEKQYQLHCTHCGKVLFSKTGLIAHIKQFHAETIKLYPCPKCGKTFRQKGNMKTHLISHTKERAFKCDICGKAFKYPDQLNRHRLEHTLTQKFSCDMCDKQFVRSYELRNHVRNYHSGFVYVCGVCHECCAHRHTIIRHYKRKHPEVGNVFEEKPEFLDSLQKPVSAATQSRMMTEGEDVKPVMRLGAFGNNEIILTTEEDGTQTYSTGDVILTQNAAGELITADGEQAIQHVIEGPQGEQTVFILKVVNQDENGSVQEMEITEDTKAHLAQFIQTHGVGQDVTHIQVGGQTLQIQHEEEAEAGPSGGEAGPGQVELVQEIKLDPDQLAQLQAQGQVHIAKELQGPGHGGAEEDGGEGLTAMGPVSAGQVVNMVEMNNGQLQQIITVDGRHAQVVGGNQQVLQLMEVDGATGMVMANEGLAATTAAAGTSSQAGQQHPMSLANLPGLKVTKRRRSNGEILVEVEGESGNMVDLGDSQAVMSLVQGQLEGQAISLDLGHVATSVGSQGQDLAPGVEELEGQSVAMPTVDLDSGAMVMDVGNGDDATAEHEKMSEVGADGAHHITLELPGGETALVLNEGQPVMVEQEHASMEASTQEEEDQPVLETQESAEGEGGHVSLEQQASAQEDEQAALGEQELAQEEDGSKPGTDQTLSNQSNEIVSEENIVPQD